MNSKHIALVSHLYPNQSFPASGTFIRDYYLKIRQHASVKMIIPSVRSIPFTRKWRFTHDSFLNDHEACRLRYLSFPGMKLPRIIRHNLSSALLTHIRKNAYDLIHFNWLFPDGMAIPAVKDRNIPVILTVHGSDWYNTYHRPALKYLVYESLAASDTIFVVGNKLKNDMLSEYPDLRENVHTSYNPVDFQKFQPPASRKETLEKLAWDPDKNHLLCVANISPEKGVDVLIKALKLIEYKNTILHIIGNVPSSQYSQKVIDAIHNSENARLYPPVSHDRISDYYRACDILVLPSRREGFGLALAEAIACGKPVVSTKSGGPEDIVTPENGYLVDPDAPEQLAEKIDRLLSKLAELDSEKIRSSIRDKFDSEKSLSGMLEHYQRVCNK